MNKILILIVVITTILVSCNTNNSTKISNKEIESEIDTGIIAIITKQIVVTPTNAELFKNRAEEYFNIRDIENAIKDLETAIKIDSTNADYLNLISDYWIIKGNSKPTKDYLNKCIALYPDNTGALIRLAKLHLYIEDYQEAFNYINEAIKINSGLYTPYFVKGLCYDDMGDTLRAIKQYQIAIERNPEFYDGYLLLGLKYAQLKDTIAIQYYRNAINLIPKSIEANYNLAYFYQENNYIQRALNEYDNIIENVDSTFFESYYNKGYIYLEITKEYKKAFYNFQMANIYKPNIPSILHNIGLSYQRNGDLTNAKKYYNKALEIDPNYTYSLNALKKLK